MGLYKIVMLGPLYKMDTFKGKVNWLILILCKLILPSVFVLLSERSEDQSYKWKAINFYKAKMFTYCEAYNYHYEIYGDDWLDEDNYDVISSQQTDYVIYDEAAEKRIEETNRKKLMQMLSYLDKQNYSDVRSPHKYATEACCKKFSDLRDGHIKCLKDQGFVTSTLSFVLFMFVPLFSNIFVAVIMALIKNSKFVQRKFQVYGNNPNVQLTAEEVTTDVQEIFQFIVDLVAFYTLVYKVWALSQSITACIRYSSCLPSYQSPQMYYLLASAQAPWMSILWGFIYT